MAKLEDGFTIKLPKKGSNNLLLPIVALCAFLMISIAFGMYVYEPIKSDVVTTNKILPIVNDVSAVTDNTPNSMSAQKLQEQQSILLENNSSSAIARDNTTKESTANPVQEFKQVVHFGFDSTEIKDYDNRALQKFLADNQDRKLKIIIDGHTDAIGNEDYNQYLSERRANSVEQELMTMTSPQSDITKKNTGYGETKPVDTNDSIEGRANNRRVELTIIVLP